MEQKFIQCDETEIYNSELETCEKKNSESVIVPILTKS